MAAKGKFKPKNPSKYKGDPTNITYRSGWELTMMMKFDNNPNVIEWSSEEVVVQYRSALDEAIEVKQKLSYRRWHRYYVDFYVKTKNKDGTFNRMLIEVKPAHEVVQPTRSMFKSERSFRAAVKKWVVNDAKWKAARSYAADHNMKFEIYTEEKIFGKRN